ncbi:hypothetical protein BH09PSE2_BH09PSE2_16340 [soil metagenome]
MRSEWKTPAARRYTLRVMGFMTAYVLVLLAVGFWFRSVSPPQGLLKYAAAVAPALPVIGVLWAMGAFMVELTDEYQRLKLAKALLRATGITLAACTAWGFLQTYAEAASPPLYYVFILFIAAFGLVQAVSSLLERR